MNTNRDDFLFLKQGIIYFDSAATSLKPKFLCESLSDYYNNYSANAHRGDYDISYKVDALLAKTRYLVSEFIGASEEEVIFTSGATDSLNKIVLSFFEDYLEEGDEVLLTKSEHASNILPWFELQKRKNITIKYIPLDENLEINMDNVIQMVNDKTKVISLAHITNVIGDTRPIKEITTFAHSKNILVILDSAQSISHIKTNVKELDVDFLAFSAHKILGPTGLGILYGKKEHLKKFKPLIVGGGMNMFFTYDGMIKYSELPYFLEAGTQNIAAIISFGKVIEYLNKIDLEKMESYVKTLREYAVNRLKENHNIIIYNDNIDTSLITFNYKGINALDLAQYLNNYKICIRAGNHCAKMLKDEIGINDTCRISLYFYNNKEEVDYLIAVLNNPNIRKDVM